MFWSSVTLGKNATKVMPRSLNGWFWSSVTLGKNATDVAWMGTDCQFWSSVTLGKNATDSWERGLAMGFGAASPWVRTQRERGIHG